VLLPAIFALKTDLLAGLHKATNRLQTQLLCFVLRDDYPSGSSCIGLEFPLTPNAFRTTLRKWLDSLRVESVTTKSTHFVALTEYPRNSPHRAAWVSFLTPQQSGRRLDLRPRIQ
jgi:hypothetical protein